MVLKKDSYFKINLGLYVTEKRKDGFHNLETIFYPVDLLCDTIEMESSDKLLLEMDGADFEVAPEKNICVKAFRLLQERFALPGAKFRLTKRIPSGAGLGGGSADAATVLKMTNELFNLQLSNQILKELAILLGSDVPFFIDPVPSYATGKGEILQPIEMDLSGKVISVFKPDFSVSTAAAYARIHPVAGRPCLTELVKKPFSQWKEWIVNDFETSLTPSFPVLSEIKSKFYELGADYASLSGSGSAVFAIADSPIHLAPFFSGIDL